MVLVLFFEGTLHTSSTDDHHNQKRFGLVLYAGLLTSSACCTLAWGKVVGYLGLGGCYCFFG